MFRYCQGIIHLDAEIPDRAFDLGMAGQELDSAAGDIFDPDGDDITASKLAVDSQIEHGKGWGSRWLSITNLVAYG